MLCFKPLCRISMIGIIVGLIFIQIGCAKAKKDEPQLEVSKNEFVSQDFASDNGQDNTDIENPPPEDEDPTDPIDEPYEVIKIYRISNRNDILFSNSSNGSNKIFAFYIYKSMHSKDMLALERCMSRDRKKLNFISVNGCNEHNSQGIIGYMHSGPRNGHIPLYLFFNMESGVHNLITINTNDGSGENYRFDSILGFVPELVSSK